MYHKMSISSEYFPPPGVQIVLDIFWLRDESLEDSANLPDPDVLAREIVEKLQAALA